MRTALRTVGHSRSRGGPPWTDDMPSPPPPPCDLASPRLGRRGRRDDPGLQRAPRPARASASQPGRPDGAAGRRAPTSSTSRTPAAGTAGTAPPCRPPTRTDAGDARRPDAGRDPPTPAPHRRRAAPRRATARRRRPRHRSPRTAATTDGPPSPVRPRPRPHPRRRRRASARSAARDRRDGGPSGARPRSRRRRPGPTHGVCVEVASPPGADRRPRRHAVPCHRHAAPRRPRRSAPSTGTAPASAAAGAAARRAPAPAAGPASPPHRPRHRARRDRPPRRDGGARRHDRRVARDGHRGHVVVVGGAAHDVAPAHGHASRSSRAAGAGFRPDSELCRLNAGAGPPGARLGETCGSSRPAVDAWHDTGGRFDPTVLEALEAAATTGRSRSVSTARRRRRVPRRPTPGCAARSACDPVAGAVTLPRGTAPRPRRHRARATPPISSRPSCSPRGAAGALREPRRRPPRGRRRARRGDGWTVGSSTCPGRRRGGDGGVATSATTRPALDACRRRAAPRHRPGHGPRRRRRRPRRHRLRAGRRAAEVLATAALARGRRHDRVLVAHGASGVLVGPTPRSRRPDSRVRS